MARQKKTEEVEPEVIVEETVATETPVEDVVAETPTEDIKAEETPVEDVVEEVVKEKPKTTRKKRTTKKTESADASADKVTTDEIKAPTVVEAKSTDASVPYRAIVVVGKLMVRTGPGIDYNRIKDIPMNTKITVLEELGSWGRVGKGLWVSTNNIKKI